MVVIAAQNVHTQQALIAMTTLMSRLQLALLNRKKGRNLIEKGFTLVELMIVIVIVGVLSSVALPNFLKQTDKAKATEAKSNLTAILKQVQTSFLETGDVPTSNDTITTAAELLNYGAPQDNIQKFNYTAIDNGTSPDIVYTVMAKGNLKDKNLTGKKVFGCIALDTGVINTSDVLLVNAADTSDVDCGITASKDSTLK